ncbi:ABC transporter permease [Kribbella solani]|uniref:Peptide/nickel transport system permease protein n=1 Tax=Kribbella solani TaxID=236067 RepID=A0A841DQ15_9ACTN|nr:ABC transporter permease [Kribbella solani]MBB5977528.1 peptide/nickel transport system permease protein [Kribbella solani]
MLSSTFLTRRIGRLLVSVWVLVSASFAMIHLVPGDPVRSALGLTASPEVVEARREALGLNNSLPTQYVDYLRSLLHGDFGTSIVSNLPVSQVIQERLPASLQLAVPAFVVLMVLAVVLGVVTAVLTRGGRRPGLHLGYTAASTILGAIPDFILAVVLVAVFAVGLGWLPVAGRDGISSFILPVLTLSLGAAAVLSRVVRAELLSVLDNDFVRTAKSKRLPARIVYLRHALPNALTATLTIGGLLLAGLAAGMVLVENVFQWPGMGTVLVQSIQQKDYPMVQALVLVYGGLTLTINLCVDLLLAFLDPRSTVKAS